MKTIIFGGTTEGREQAALALARGESVLVSVTSEYARQFLPEGAACHIGALDESAMKAWIAAERPERVIDATHPFAVRAHRPSAPAPTRCISPTCASSARRTGARIGATR